MAPPRGGQRRDRPRAERAPLDPEAALEAAEELEEGINRHVGAQSIRAAQRASDAYAAVEAMPAASPKDRWTAVVGRARCWQHIGDTTSVAAESLSSLSLSRDLFASALSADGSDWDVWYNHGQVCSSLAEARSPDTSAQLSLYLESLSSHRRCDALLQVPNSPLAERVDCLVAGGLSASHASVLSAAPQSHELASLSDELVSLALSAASACEDASRVPTVQLSWAESLLVRAAAASPSDAPAHFERALELQSLALQSPDVDPVSALCDRTDASYNYATHLASPGDPSSAVLPLERRQALADGALRDISNAIQLKDGDPAMLSRLGDVHLLRFHLGGGNLALHEAERAYVRAMSVPFKPLKDADTLHNLAATYALGGDAERCVAALRAWAEVASEQDREEMRADEDFASVRGTSAFKEIVGE